MKNLRHNFIPFALVKVQGQSEVCCTQTMSTKMNNGEMGARTAQRKHKRMGEFFSVGWNAVEFVHTVHSLLGVFNHGCHPTAL